MLRVEIRLTFELLCFSRSLVPRLGVQQAQCKSRGLLTVSICGSDFDSAKPGQQLPTNTDLEVGTVPFTVNFKCIQTSEHAAHTQHQSKLMEALKQTQTTAPTGPDVGDGA
jgi:hypothetical protein